MEVIEVLIWVGCMAGCSYISYNIGGVHGVGVGVAEVCNNLYEGEFMDDEDIRNLLAYCEQQWDEEDDDG